jgi:RNA polymerase sigma factor (sigma-70 family)
MMDGDVIRNAVTSIPSPEDKMRLLNAMDDYARKLDRQSRASLFRMVYEYYREPLGRRLFYLVNDAEVAKDLYHDTFVQVWKTLQEGKLIQNFEAWLYVVARNLAIDYIRHMKKIQFSSYSKEDASEGFAALNFFAEAGHEEHVCEMECLKQVLSQMSQQYRICFLLQYFWGYSQREIASTLKISEKSVSANVSRGREQFRTIYKKITSDQSAIGREE